MTSRPVNTGQTLNNLDNYTNKELKEKVKQCCVEMEELREMYNDQLVETSNLRYSRRKMRKLWIKDCNFLNSLGYYRCLADNCGNWVKEE